MPDQPDPCSLEGLCVATRFTLNAIVATHPKEGSHLNPAMGAVYLARADYYGPREANQVILALRGLMDHVPEDHEIPLYEALAGLVVDGVCGPQCDLAAKLLDSIIEHEANKRTQS